MAIRTCMRLLLWAALASNAAPFAAAADPVDHDAHAVTFPTAHGAMEELRKMTETQPLTALEKRTAEIAREELRRQQALDPAPTAAAVYIVGADANDVRVISNGGATETIRDPCLLSPDPHCHEKHAGEYHPYFGYAPSIMGAAGAVPTGAAR